MIQQERLIRHFMELVQIDSETKREQEISKALKEQFAALGLKVEEDATAAATGHGSGNLICTLDAVPGGEGIPSMFFTCHMDTVAPGKGIKPRLDKDGYFRSDGTTILGSDDKAGLAALFEAIRVVKEQNIVHGKIQFIITAGEESGLRGSRAMDPKWLDAEFGYAVDSNGAVGGIAVAAPAQCKMQITFTGKAAHAGVNPEDGVSAITVASKAVSRMQLGRIDSQTTANIGSFAGTGETNVVCDKAMLAAEARSLDNGKLDRQVQSMRQACESAAAEMGASVEFHSEVIYPAFLFEDDAPLVKMATAAVESIGRTPKTFHTGGGSDANVFNGMGVPTVNLSVGYENIHTTAEQMPLSELTAVAELVVAVIRQTQNLKKS